MPTHGVNNKKRKQLMLLIIQKKISLMKDKEGYELKTESQIKSLDFLYQIFKAPLVSKQEFKFIKNLTRPALSYGNEAWTTEMSN
jgi:hypothetical protein